MRASSTFDVTSTKPEDDDLKQENQQLFEELTTLTDDVKLAEAKIIEVSRLQAVLSENIAQQAATIDQIYSNVVEATENVSEGNEQVKQAIKSSIDFQLGVFLFFVMCSFSLLFLDWYKS